MKSDNDATCIGIHAVSALDDIAIRNYYQYYLLSKLVSQNQKSVIDTISLPIMLGITVVSFLLGQLSPVSTPAILIIYLIVMIVLTIVLIVDKSRNKCGHVLDDEIYLFIHLDQVAKFTRQLKLILRVVDTKDELAKSYEEKIAMILKESLEGANSFMENLRDENRYPDCLKDFGWDEKFANEKIKEAEALLEKLNNS